MPSTAIPPSPTAAAQRLTEPERIVACGKNTWATRLEPPGQTAHTFPRGRARSVIERDVDSMSDRLVLAPFPFQPGIGKQEISRFWTEVDCQALKFFSLSLQLRLFAAFDSPLSPLAHSRQDGQQ